jgi:hypothetical protein
LEESEVPEKIRNRSMVINGDADKIINKIYELIKDYKSDL